MSARDEMSKELSAIIKREYTRAIDRKRMRDCYDAPADAILAAGYSKPRAITTAEELEAIPRDSVLLAGSRIYQKERGALMDLGIGLMGYEEVLEESGTPTLIYSPEES